MGCRQVLPQKLGEPVEMEGEIYEVFPWHSPAYCVDDWRDVPEPATVAGILEWRFGPTLPPEGVEEWV